MSKFEITYMNGENYWGYGLGGIYSQFTIDCSSLEEAIKFALDDIEEETLRAMDYPKSMQIYPDTEYFKIDGTTYHVISPGVVEEE
tara:strand:- start:71 stop:328 length:258 start_codon:yes stop_codon:yes gene_type:complete